MAGIIKLDELLGKKKEAPQVLDLSKSIVTSKEDFKRLMEKVPEYKIRPEKVRMDDLKMREKNFNFQAGRREFRRQGEFWYPDPVPPDMRVIKLEDLNSVAIDWKMLTLVRPKAKQDEEMFSRLVFMGKMHLRSAAAEKRVDSSGLIRRSKNRAGILETRVVTCGECGEEFCAGDICNKLLYECFFRSGELERTPGAGTTKPKAGERGRAKSPKKKKKRRGKRSRSSKRRKKKDKSKGDSKTDIVAT